MNSVKKYSIEQLISIINKKTVRFVSDCQLFPNFDVKGYAYEWGISKTGELLFKIKTASKKSVTIGCNMLNLKFEVFDKA